MIRQCHCGELFTPHSPHEWECDGCQLAAMALTNREDEDFGRAEQQARAEELKEAA